MGTPKKRRFVSRKGVNKARQSLRGDNTGDPLLWVDEEEWQTWPRCVICGRLIRKRWMQSRKRTVMRHETCRLAERGKSIWLNRGDHFGDDLTPEQIDQKLAQNEAQIAYKRRTSRSAQVWWHL